MTVNRKKDAVAESNLSLEKQDSSLMQLNFISENISSDLRSVNQRVEEILDSTITQMRSRNKLRRLLAKLDSATSFGMQIDHAGSVDINHIKEMLEKHAGKERIPLRVLGSGMTIHLNAQDAEQLLQSVSQKEHTQTARPEQIANALEQTRPRALTGNPHKPSGIGEFVPIGSGTRLGIVHTTGDIIADFGKTAVSRVNRLVPLLTSNHASLPFCATDKP